MIKPEYCAAIDVLRQGYAQPGLKKDSFPGKIRAAITDSELPEIGEGEYTLSQVISIITTFQNTLPDDKSNFDCLQVFETSSLIQNYRTIGDLCFLDTTAEADAATSKPVEVDGINLESVDDVPVKPKKHAAFAGVSAKAGKNRISELPKRLTQRLIEGHLGQYLNTKDIVSFGSTSSRFFELSTSVKLTRKLLEHVVRGEQQEAEHLLKKYPQLLIQKSEVTDYSDRTFHNASPWECMLWAMDTRYMGQMMLTCIPEGPDGDAIRRECLAQYKAMQVDGGGIHYEQPAACKALVRLDGAVSPEARPFADIEGLFDTSDALLFWNNQFYYANKADSSVTPIAPSTNLTAKQTTDLRALKRSLTAIKANTSRLPSTLKEHQLINTLFRGHPAFKPTHHCESHYAFGVINALQTYVHRFDDLNWDQRNALWMNLVAKAQRLAPKNLLEHLLDPDRAFYPLPDFKATTFKRETYFYNWVTDRWTNLFSRQAFDSDFGFKFGLIRAARKAGRGGGGGPSEALDDLSALRRLRKVRTEDARWLQDQLHQSLVPAPSGPTGAGGPS